MVNCLRDADSKAFDPSWQKDFLELLHLEYHLHLQKTYFIPFSLVPYGIKVNFEHLFTEIEKQRNLQNLFCFTPSKRCRPLISLLNSPALSYIFYPLKHQKPIHQMKLTDSMTRLNKFLTKMRNLLLYYRTVRQRDFQCK